MDIQQAVKFIDKHQRASKSKETALQLVQKLWNQLDLSTSDVRSLAKGALSQKYSAFKTSGQPIARQPEYTPYRRSQSEQPREVDVEIGKLPEKSISVEVKILYDTTYDVGGQRKAFIDFTLHDLRYKMDDYEQQIEGHTRHFKVMKYARERLAKLGKNAVSELAQGEQTILAQKLKAAKNGSFEEAA